MNRPPSAGALFECVAHRDYDGLLHVLAAEGMRVLQSRSSWEGMSERCAMRGCE